MRVDMLGSDVPEQSSGGLYSMEKFEQDVQSFRPRTFDTYILPGFLMIYAFKSKQMRKTARRILFTSGVYMMYRNWTEYKTALANMKAILPVAEEQQV